MYLERILSTTVTNKKNWLIDKYNIIIQYVRFNHDKIYTVVHKYIYNDKQ